MPLFPHAFKVVFDEEITPDQACTPFQEHNSSSDLKLASAQSRLLLEQGWYAALKGHLAKLEGLHSARKRAA